MSLHANTTGGRATVPAPTTPLGRVLARLRDVRPSGNGWMAQCPVHEDSTPSLSINVDPDDGKVLLHCFGTCTTEQVVRAIGLEMRDLFATSNGVVQPPSKSAPIALQNAAPSNGTAKPRSRAARHIVRTYDYRDEQGAVLFQVVRFEPKDFRQRQPDGHGDWVWNLDGVRRVLYRLPELLAADPEAPVFMVEGEKDADRLAALGLVVVTNPGGAGKWLTEYGASLRGRHVVILPDNDEAGQQHAQQVAQALHDVAASVRILTLPDLPPKGDVSDFLEHGGTAEQLAALVEAAPYWTPSSSSSSSLSINDDDYDEMDWLITTGDLVQRYGGPCEYLVEEYILRSGLTLITGAPASLKSWAVVDLARAVHTGGKWLGHFEVPHGPVIYVEQERARNYAYQVEQLQRGYGVDLSSIHAIPPLGLNLTNPLWQERLTIAVKRCQPVLMIINSLRPVFRGQPGSGIDTNLALGWLGTLAEQHNVSVVIVDQLNKPGINGVVRGAAAHADSAQKEYEADSILHIERDRDELGKGTGPARVYVGKLREGTDGPPFTFDVVDQDHGGVQVLYGGETTVERSGRPKPLNAQEKAHRALLDAAAPLTPQEVADKAGLELNTARNALTALRAAGKAEKAGHGLWQSSSSSSSLSVSDDDDFEDAPEPEAPASIDAQSEPIPSSLARAS